MLQILKMDLERLHAKVLFFILQIVYGLCERGEGGMPERPQDRLRASRPSFPSQESKTDEDCQERGRETRSEVSARSKAQAMRRSVTIHTTQISVF